MLIVRSPMRISFAGGGTDLPAYYERFGGEVVSAAINKHFYTVLQKRSDDQVQLISSDLRVLETWRDIGQIKTNGSELEIPISVLKELNCNVGMSLFLASEIPPGTGLGSSATVCVTVLKAISTYLHVPLSKYELADRAFHIARNVLNKPVGKQDEYASAFGGFNRISFHPSGSVTVEPLSLDPDLLRELQDSLLLFFTGAAHNSWSILQEQESATRKHSSPTLESLHEIRALAAEMRSTLGAGDLQRFGLLLHAGWEAKKRVSSKISTSRIDQMYAIAREHGALGGKITGAGGGGFLLLFCPPDAKAAVRQALAQCGVQEMQFEFDFQGAQVVVDDPFIDQDDNCGARWTFFSVSNSSDRRAS